MTRRRAAYWPLVGVFALGLSGCGAARQPLLTTGFTGVSSHDCVPSFGLATGSRVTVDPSTLSVTAVWLPGLNGACAPVITDGGPSVAAALAEDIRTAPNPPSGVFHCPADTGVGVELYFAYRHRHSSKRVDVRLTGCGGVAAPGRSSLSLTTRLRSDLVPITPPGWLRWVRF